MNLFGAGDWDIGPLIKVGVFVVAGGIWLINQLLGKKGQEKQAAPMPRQWPQPKRPQMAEPVGQGDIDDFLDEVMGRGAAPLQRPPAPPRQAEPVVLRPQQPRPPVRRPETRPAGRQPQRRPPRPPTPAEQAMKPPPMATPVASGFTESVQQDMVQAAGATQAAGALTPATRQASLQRRTVDVGTLVAMLKSPADFHRAVLLSEVLGPPLARRRRRV